ncbi:MAG TPA: amidohydrolase family protein [Bryobacteraceae bacterium]|jgi:5-methylthioadenosine/S-adenosylhomocysteine deaminase
MVWLAVLCWPAGMTGQPADLIVTARYVVTMDAQQHVIDDGAVAIRGERIAAVGKRSDIDRRFQAAQHLDKGDAIVMPGLINTHAHAAMSLFRGIADDLNLQDWLTKFIFPAEKKNVSPEFVRWGTRLACLEMLLGGVTTYTDMYYYEDMVAATTREAGMRGVLGETVIGFPVNDAANPAAALKAAEGFIRHFHNDSLIVPAVAPHAPYTNSDETLKSCRILASRYNAPVLIHLSETKKENDDSMREHHMTPAQRLDGLGFFRGRTVVAHAVWVTDGDIAILKRNNTGVAHCPSSNMKLASGAAPVVKMLERGLNVGLGTDGPAGSNNDFDLFEEMDLAAKLQKLTTGDPRALPARTAVAMATITGAKALGMEKEIGSLEAGKRADLITIRLDRPHAVPMYDVYSQLVYALKASDVVDVVVNGRVVVRDAKCLTIDAPATIAKAREYGLKIAQSVK